MKRALTVFVFLMVSTSFLFSAEIEMEFRNQKITDIIYSLSALEEKTVYCDESVSGNATFIFRDSDFESALRRFADAYGLFVEKEGGVYNISKVKVENLSDGKVSVEAEEVSLSAFLKILSRKTNTTIVTDTLPQSNVSIRIAEGSLIDILKTAIVNLGGYDIEVLRSGYYIYKALGSGSISRSTDNFTVSKLEDGFYEINVRRANAVNLIDSLFIKEGKEYSLLSKPSVTLENLNYREKDFESLLRIILDQCSCDFTQRDNVYYIFEVQKTDILKNYRETRVIELKNISVEKLLSIMPSELSSSNYVKTDKDNNLVFLTGSSSQIDAIEDFIRLSDIKQGNGVYRRFDLLSLSVPEAVALIPRELILSEVMAIPDTNSFMVLVTEENRGKLEDFIREIDGYTSVYTVKLKYIRSSDLLKYLPPSVDKSSITESPDIRTVFFSGSKAKYEAFMKELSEIDKPAQQIKYSILIVQRQRTDSLNWASAFNIGSTEGSKPSYAYSTSLGNIFNIKFDVISGFGMEFAENFSSELGSGLSHVLADTTLNGISGESVKFSNTNTYRYRDIVIEGATDRYTSTTREINSGLVLNIEGWVSGDDMITVNIDAAISKQGSAGSTGDTSNPPSTSEMKVSTVVRSHSGESVVIGGLFQQEEDSSEGGVPFISEVQGVGELFKNRNKSASETEFIIYLIPSVEKEQTGQRDIRENIRRYYEKYMREEP